VFEGFHSRDIGGAYVYHKGAWPFANHSDPAQAPRGAPRPARTRNKASEAHTIATPPRYLLRRQPLAEISHDLQAYIDTAQEFLAAGDVDRALAQFALLPANSALAADAYLQAARACADRGALEHAIMFAMRSIKHDPTSEGAYQLLGAIYARQRQWERAAQQLERARYLDPENALTSYRLAEAYRASGRAEAAVREYRNVLMKLVEQPPDTMLDGVAVAWIRDTCQRHLDGQV
jgi:chemotaxis protein methyltransferase CheR